MKKLRKISKHHRNRISINTTFEQFSTELFFEIFDYLTSNEIYKSFFGLNHRFNELIYNTPNVHLDLTRTKTKFCRHFRQIFPKQNIVSIVILYEHVRLLETIFNSTDEIRLRSLSILTVPLRAFETRLREILNIFKFQLNSLKIVFSDMHYTGTGVYAAQSFAYILTELPSLKRLTLEYSEGIDSITYIPSVVVVNNTIINLTLSLHDPKRLVPLLYRFEVLKTLNIYCPVNLPRRKMARRDDVEYYRSQLRERTSIDYPMKIRHINTHHYPLVLDKVDQLFKLVNSSTLLTLSLFNCERPAVRHSMPRRQPPFLDGTNWHDLLKESLLSSMKRFYIEYEDVDQTMSITNSLRVSKELMKYNRLPSSWNISCSYDQDKKLLGFNYSSI